MSLPPPFYTRRNLVSTATLGRPVRRLSWFDYLAEAAWASVAWLAAKVLLCFALAGGADGGGAVSAIPRAGARLNLARLEPPRATRAVRIRAPLVATPDPSLATH